MPKKIPIEKIQIGMMFSEPVYLDDSSVLVDAGVEIKEADYNKLIRWSIRELYTDGELIQDKKNIKKNNKDFNTSNKNEEKITAEYIKIFNRCLSVYENFIDNLINNKEFDKPKLEAITNDIIEVTKNYKNDIMGYIALELKNYVFLITHAINTTIIAIIGGRQFGLDEKELMLLGIAGLLHDIGMLKIPQNILNKKGKLTDEEYNIIKSHPIAAFKQMNKAKIFNKDVLDAVLQHQEQFDGNGYPRRIKGDKINIYARILAIADSFEAQIAYRVYRKSKTGYSAMKTVLSEALNKFDPKVLRAFLTILSIYPPGTLVQMNDNSIGAVASINSDAPLRPKVKIIVDIFGDKIVDHVIKDLRDGDELFIAHVLNKDEYMKKQ